MKRPIKANAGERLTPDNIERVIAALNPTDGSKPVTKTVACAMLNIKYNTSRLDKILTDYQTKKARTKQLRDARKGVPLTKSDIQNVIEEILLGYPISKIAESMYRSTSLIKRTVEEVGIPGYNDDDEETFGLFPEQCIASEFDVPIRDASGAIIIDGEVAYYPKKDCLVIIDMLVSDKNPMNLYRVYDKDIGYHHVYSGDLASLKHLQEYGVNFDKLRTKPKYAKPSASDNEG